MSQRPSVVVVIPYYNGAKWIERALASVASQSVPADEIIVVNDGSRADERAFLDGIKSRYPFRIVDKPNGGQGSARNAGVAASKSTYISFLDQDDYYLDQHIEDLLAHVPADDPWFGFVYADLREADDKGNIVTSNMLRWYTDPTSHPKRGHVMRMLREDLFILPSASLILREAFQAVGGFDEQFTGYEDDDLFLRLFRAGYTNYFLDKPVTVWFRHDASTSWTLKMSESRFRYFKKLSAMFPDRINFELFYFRDALIYRFEPKFLRDVERALESDSEHLPRLREILREYVALVDAQPNVPAAHKAKLRGEILLLTLVPPPALRVIQRVTRLPGVKRVVKALRGR
jgi:glycosyltransferase involved in cell wall biosynthesis